MATLSAVEVRNGYKYYGSKTNPKIVLNYLNMTVMPGSIYGLLGASGCGKTTLLSCIVGQRQLHSGTINVLGMVPGAPGSGIPGARIGYMPQEIALVEEMTVKQNIYYFGRLYGMTDERLYEKFKILHSLLQLPPAHQLVKSCSGGQQRRVSFACAMIHDPELLILDEPTVGLDPMLRERIWDFLVETTRNSNQAVIITTHYIEEARQANCIGLMRNGVLLAEDTPEKIMQRYEVSSVEEAFLILSQRQGTDDEVGNGRRQLPPSHQTQSAMATMAAGANSLEIVTSNNNSTSFDLNSKDMLKQIEGSQGERSTNKNLSDCNKSSINSSSSWLSATRGRIKALMVKNFIQLFRQPSGVIFMLLFPILDLGCFYLAVGRNPANLRVGIVNNEVDQWHNCYSPNLITVTNYNETCNFHQISCRFIHEMDRTDDLKGVFYNSIEEAQRDASDAKIWGYIHFATNFSQSLQSYIESGKYVEDNDLENAQIGVYMDMTDYQVSYFIQHTLRNKFVDFTKGILNDCNLPTSLLNIVNFERPIYGTEEVEFQQYVAPGVIMTMVFFLAALMTAAVFISERLDGVWDRTMVAGVSPTQILWAHLLNQLIVMVLQSCEVIAYVGLVFNSYNMGDTNLLIFLLTLNSFCGMLYGLLISIYCKSHTEANFMATGTFYPMIILCGLLWPLEGMPDYLRSIVMYFPFTLPCISARNIIEKGWDLTHHEVYNGFLVMAAWIVIFFTLCMIGIKRKA